MAEFIANVKGDEDLTSTCDNALCRCIPNFCMAILTLARPFGPPQVLCRPSGHVDYAIAPVWERNFTYPTAVK